MRKCFGLLAGLVSCFGLVFAGVAQAGDTGFDYPYVVVTPSPDADFTGVGTSPLDPAQFDGRFWGRSARVGAPGTCTNSDGSPMDQSCRWFYPDYRNNCLSSSSSAAAIQVLWVYDDSRSSAVLWRNQGTNLTKLRGLLRGVGSAMAANSQIDVINADGSLAADRKAADRSPRWVADANATCGINVTEVPVPARVLARSTIQVNAYGVYKPGLFPWLADNGFNAANRDYLVLDDQTGTPADHHCKNQFLSPGAETAAPAVWTMLWGPYGTGKRSDVVENPLDPDHAMPDWGGGFIDDCVSDSFMDTAADYDHRNAGYFMWRVLHEMVHLLGEDADQMVDLDNGGHLPATYTDPMGGNRTGPDAIYCANYAMSVARPDCNHDQYWATQGYDLESVFATSGFTPPQWSASDNAFLWGGRKPATYTRFNIRSIGFDFCVSDPPKCVDN